MAKKKITSFEIKNLLEKEIAFTKVGPEVRKYMLRIRSNNSEFFASNGLDNVPTFGTAVLENEMMNKYHYDGQSYRDLRRHHPILKISMTMERPLNAMLVLSSYHDPKNAMQYLTFLAFKLYTSKHKKYWDFVKPEVMEETYMALSNKYTIKQVKTVDRYLIHIVNKTNELYKKELKRMNDQDIIDYVNELSAKINSYLKHVRREYQKVDENGKGVYQSREIKSEEITISNDNQTDKINSVIYTVSNEELARGYDNRTVDIVRGKEFKPVLKEVYSKKGKEIGQIVEMIVNDYVKKSGNASSDIKREFIIYANKGRNKDPQIKTEIVDLVKDIEDVNRSKFYNMYYKYICTRIYDTMVELGL